MFLNSGFEGFGVCAVYYVDFLSVFEEMEGGDGADAATEREEFVA